jgi:CubicO group peptidase (beta-lactamase class C family)
MLDIIAWHGSTGAEHQQKLDAAAGKNYRTLSLSIYSSTDNPLYACVMIKRPVVIAERQFFGLDATAFQQTFNEMAAAGMGPHIVSATGPADGPVFAASFIPVHPTPLTKFGLTAAEFTALNQQQTSAGNKLVWFDCYGTSGKECYIAVWWPDPEMMAWNCDGVGESGTAAQQRFDGLVKTWARCAQIMTTPAGNITSLYTDGSVGATEVRFGLSGDAYQTLFNQLGPKGLVPLRVSVQGSGGDAIFGVVFGETEETTARVWRTTGPQTVASVDGAIETFLKATNIRGASLAIVDGTRLVYARGYTWAEAAYPDVQPATVFRQASCSKIFTAYALYGLLQGQLAKIPAGQAKPTFAALLAKTTLQSVLHLTQPNGSQPADPKFAAITLLDLMTSTSGLDQNLIWDSVAASNGDLPATRLQLARYGAAQTFTATPGNPKNVVYGNFDYFLLGEVVRAMSGAASFEAAVETLIMKPLGLTRVRGSHSLLSEQPPDEGHYHLVQPAKVPPNSELTAGPSVRTEQQPLVASQYGAFDLEMLGACGGLSVACVDMARLVASLSLRNGSPTLAPDTIDQWMNNAVLATKTLSAPGGDAHGYHGWDWVVTTDAGAFYGDKGGALPGTGTETYFTTGGLSYIFFLGGGGRPGVTIDWYQPLIDAATAHDWGSTDLFPQYGMPNFPAQTGQKAPMHKVAVPIGRRDFPDLVPKAAAK